MFLTQLYRHNKFICFCLLAFILVFIAVDIKQGLTVTPISMFGMYSAPQHLKDTIGVSRLFSGGRLFNLSKLPVAERDMIIESYNRYYNSRQGNLETYETFTRVLHARSFFSPKRFNDDCGEEKFQEWFDKKLAAITGWPLHFKIKQVPATIKNGELAAADSTTN